MGVGQGASAGREMLGAGGDAAFAHPAVPLAGVVDDFLRVAAPAAAAEGILEARVVVEVEHRGEVQVEAEQAELVAGENAAAGGKQRVVLGGEGVGRGQGRGDFLGAGDPAAFLVDREDRLVECELAQFVGQPSRLLRRDDVPAEEDEARGLELAEQGRLVRSDLRTADAEQEQLAVHGGSVMREMAVKSRITRPW